MQVDGDRYRKVAGYGPAPGSPIGTERPLNRDSVAGRAIIDREAIHIHDFLEVAAEYSRSASPRARLSNVCLVFLYSARALQLEQLEFAGWR